MRFSGPIEPATKRGLSGVLGGPAVGGLAGEAGAGEVDVAHRALQLIVGLGDRGGGEGVGLG